MLHYVHEQKRHKVKALKHIEVQTKVFVAEAKEMFSVFFMIGDLLIFLTRIFSIKLCTNILITNKITLYLAQGVSIT